MSAKFDNNHPLAVEKYNYALANYVKMVLETIKSNIHLIVEISNTNDKQSDPINEDEHIIKLWNAFQDKYKTPLLPDVDGKEQIQWKMLLSTEDIKKAKPSTTKVKPAKKTEPRTQCIGITKKDKIQCSMHAQVGKQTCHLHSDQEPR